VRRVRCPSHGILEQGEGDGASLSGLAICRCRRLRSNAAGREVARELEPAHGKQVQQRGCDTAQLFTWRKRLDSVCTGTLPDTLSQVCTNVFRSLRRRSVRRRGGVPAHRLSPTTTFALLASVRKDVLRPLRKSREDDSGSISRTAKHFLARVNNMFMKKQEISASQL